MVHGHKGVLRCIKLQNRAKPERNGQYIVSAIKGDSVVRIILILLVSFSMQIMPEVFILGCIYALPAYRDLMRAEGPKHIPIF